MTTTTMGTESTTASKQIGSSFASYALCFAALALIGIIWEITSGLLTSGIDGIMLLAICLMMGGIFSLMILVMVYQAGVLPFFRAKPAAQASAEIARGCACHSSCKECRFGPRNLSGCRAAAAGFHPLAAVEPGYPEPPPAPKPAAKPAPAPAAKPQDS
jgi:hypothetical protein